MFPKKDVHSLFFTIFLHAECLRDKARIPTSQRKIGWSEDVLSDSDFRLTGKQVFSTIEYLGSSPGITSSSLTDPEIVVVSLSMTVSNADDE